MILRTELKQLVLLAAFSYAYLFSVNPGNLPLNDDFAYFTQVKNLLETGQIRLHPAAPAFSVVQTLYGSLLAKILGLSHIVLSSSTLVIAGLAVVLTYFFLREFVDRWLAFLGSLALLVNPIFYNLGHTFMTDVPTLVFIIPGITFLVKGFETWRFKHLLPGTFLLNLGFWNRQYSILPLGAVILYSIYALITGKQNFKLRPVVVVVALTVLNILPGLWTYYRIQDPYVCEYNFVVGGTTFKNLVQSGLFISFFLFPLGLVFLWRIRQIFSTFRGLHPLSRAVTIVFILVMIILVAGRTYYGLGNKWVPRMPFEDSTTNVYGIGPVLIVGDKPLFFPYFFWIPIILLTFFTAFSVIALMLSKLSEGRMLRLFMILLSTIVPLSLFGGFFDRYFMIAVLLVLPFFLLTVNRVVSKIGLVLLLIMFGVWSWYGTYDYLSWNQARWKGIDFLLASGVSGEKIDGGMEYVARFFKGCGNPTVQGVRQTGWAASLSDEYLISFSELTGYKTLKQIPYFGPLRENLGSIYVLQKKPQ